MRPRLHMLWGAAEARHKKEGGRSVGPHKQAGPTQPASFTSQRGAPKGAMAGGLCITG